MSIYQLTHSLLHLLFSEHRYERISGFRLIFVNLVVERAVRNDPMEDVLKNAEWISGHERHT